MGIVKTKGGKKGNHTYQNYILRVHSAGLWTVLAQMKRQNKKQILNQYLSSNTLSIASQHNFQAEVNTEFAQGTLFYVK